MHLQVTIEKNVIWKVYDLLKNMFLKGMEDWDKRFAIYRVGRLALHDEHLSHQLTLQWSWTYEFTQLTAKDCTVAYLSWHSLSRTTWTKLSQ